MSVLGVSDGAPRSLRVFLQSHRASLGGAQSPRERTRDLFSLFNMSS